MLSPLGIGPLGLAPIAILLGIIALRDIHRSRGGMKGAGFALSGIAIGVCSILVWLFPWQIVGLIDLQQQPRAARAAESMRGIQTALEAYAVDNDTLPPRLTLLTSPVAFIGTLPKDPFQKKHGNISPLFDYQTHRDFWILRSPGPDGIPDADLRNQKAWTNPPRPPGIDAQYINWLYDSTNGARSAGDIIRSRF